MLETARDIVTGSAPAGGTDLDATPGSAVQVAIDGHTVYVRTEKGDELQLTLERTLPKYSSDYRAVGSGHYLTSVAPGGVQVVLEDGSRWDIDVRQHFAVAAWKVEDLISIRRSSDDDEFAFEMVNTTEDDGTLANYRIR